MDNKEAVKRLLLLLNRYKKTIIAIVCCLFISTGLSLCVPLISQRVMDDGFIGGNKKLLIELVLASMVIYTINSLIDIIKEKKRVDISAKIQYFLSEQSFSHLMKLRVNYFNNTNYAETLNNINTDINQMTSIADSSVFFVVTQAFSMAGGIIGLFIIDFKMTVLVLLFIPIKCVVMKYFAKKQKQIMDEFILNEESVPTPAVYKQRKGCTRDWYPDGKKGGWNTSMVARIIRDERYAGHMVSHKKVYESFESKHQVAVDESDWIIVRNTHDGIVTQEEFDKANANMRTVKCGKKDNPANKKNYSVIICPHCGLTLRPGNKKDIYMYCPAGRTHNNSPCKNVRIRKDIVENTLVKLVRNQAEMLVTAENILKQKKEDRFGQDQPDMIIKRLKAEMKKLEDSKIADYESYKAGKMTREAFAGKKTLTDARKREILASIEEMEAKLLVEEADQRQYREAFEIKKYIYLEKYDKAVMAALISSAEVVSENQLNVTWKYQDIYEKIFSIL